METLERQHINIEDEMRRSYLDYAMSVIIGRALPDVRDGLKPVHRRVLWAMNELGNAYNKAYKKSARVVGDVVGKNHPHGDTAVYDTIVRMAQDFSMRYPLIDGQGNFGSVDGDAPAAMRYTEVRMARVANEVLADIEKETVNFQPNYDESLSEPTVLPTRVPNLLLNGSDGIAVGMATKIPPHTLTEIVDATIEVIRDPEVKIEKLLKIVKGPDFPTGGFICGREEIKNSYLYGRGILQMRAKATIDRIGRGSQERDAVIITELPFQVNKAKLHERIAELANEKKIEGVSDVRDESDRHGMRLVVELKRDAVPQIVLNKLFKLTPMQSSFGVINLAIVNGQPRVLTLKQMLEAFIDFRREVVRRRTEYELRKAHARAHILEGLTKAIDALDYIVTLIRNSRSVDEAKQWLTGNLQTASEVKTWKGVPSNEPVAKYLPKLKKAMERLSFSEIQAQAILDLQLRRLSALERQKIIDEYESIIKLIAELEEILANESSLRGVIVKELEEVKEQFGDARRTEITDEGTEYTIEDLIADEEVAITITKNGYIKRTPVTTYSRQGRGGKGRFGAMAKNEDFVEHLFIASTHAYLMVFTDDGLVYKMKVHEVPDAAAASRGTRGIDLRKGDFVVSVCAVSADDSERMLSVSERGYGKQTTISIYRLQSRGGKGVINMKTTDKTGKVVAVFPVEDESEIMIITQQAKLIRLEADKIRKTGRSAQGVRLIKTDEGDMVTSASLVEASADDETEESPA